MDPGGLAHLRQSADHVRIAVQLAVAGTPEGGSRSRTAATKFQVQQVIDNEDKRLDDLINVGVKVTRPDRAPFIAASKKVYDEFLKTPTEFEILEMIRKVD